MTDIRTVWDGQAALGEGPVWDASRDCLWFVDIKRQHVYRLTEGQPAERWDAPAQIGWVLPAADGTLLAGLQTGVARFDPASGRFDHLHDPEPDFPGNRLNDATVGPDGTVWFGTMDDGESHLSGRVHRFDGGVVTTTDIPAVCITNGPGIAPDGRTLYHVDTIGGIIHAVPIAADGSTGTPRDFARIDPAHGNPDGVSVDAAGNVWVGLWGGFCARRYAPDGTLSLEVALPAANITKVALGGPDLMTAYATSASIGLTDEARAAQPQAGNVFAFRVDVPGQRQVFARLA
ncbi:SMP-30/gluconolactonase/LRE family protein [Sphingomonas sp. MA1305]|uniref:SMP-30/gluconolactonase/LRE family protein n=1 Tax=unclassified Sphingomonas TaxID=196159 RepID=UPI0018DF7CC8|nr:SMP-30/gluconolactonase/LRE family protein [Sphingomonas sp. MA1305]MBI0475511.1 SMP-30/gluconolactonase/LRE family protein [Sphingomonas sp. MA1305]